MKLILIIANVALLCWFFVALPFAKAAMDRNVTIQVEKLSEAGAIDPNKLTEFQIAQDADFSADSMVTLGAWLTGEDPYVETFLLPAGLLLLVNASFLALTSVSNRKSTQPTIE